MTVQSVTHRLLDWATMTSGPVEAPQSGTPAGWLLRVVTDRRVAFLLVGAVNTAIGFVAFFGFDDLWSALRPSWFDILGAEQAGWVHNTVVLACAHVVTVICAFALYRTLVFRVRGHVWRDLARFESVYLGSIAINWVLLNAMTQWFGMVPKVAQTIIVVLQAFLSWFAHKYFSFRRAVPLPDANTDGGMP